MAEYEMPVLDLDAIEMTDEEREIANRIVTKGRLRASKPAIKYTVANVTRMIGDIAYTTRQRIPDDLGGKAAYVWRMVAFSVSPNYRHHHMPCTADFDLPVEDYTERRAMAKRLDDLVDRIVKSVPTDRWYGVRRWSRVLHG